MQNPPFRNVFVLCTGRCGSTSFERACRHATNWTSGHETRSHLLGADRLAYPDRHIEADNRLAWMLGRLEQRFGDSAAYVHLTRDPEAVAQSYAGRADYGIMHAYYHGIVFPPPDMMVRDTRPVIDHARDMVATVTANIESFLRGKPHVMRLSLESIEDGFGDFWDWTGATGNLDLAMQEWSIRHNETAPPARGRIGRMLTWPRQARKENHGLRSSPGRHAG